VKYLLDTNIVSEIRKKNCNRNVFKWFSDVSILDCYISVMTIGEIRKGIEKKRIDDVATANILEIWIKQLKLQYEGRIIVFDEKISDIWGILASTNNISAVDMQIAATAIANNCVLVTRNIKDFEKLPITIINPFE
jgi:toxin FitB